MRIKVLKKKTKKKNKIRRKLIGGTRKGIKFSKTRKTYNHNVNGNFVKENFLSGVYNYFKDKGNELHNYVREKARNITRKAEMRRVISELNSKRESVKKV